ncbi:MAG: DUF4976 domain-containing protein [Verrucomicrobia bacterium]|nr:MAG: DUF4976 domain-containing protein [Verrucomicrobiota bacterium]
MIKRRDFLKLAGLSAAGAVAFPRFGKSAESTLQALEKSAATKPNIVFVLADQWRAKATGYNGDPNVKTPNLDRLAKESLNFCNVVSACPVCTPYRAALMTGRFPTSTGMFINDAYLPSEEVCIAEVFKQAGYATAYIGKWHLDGHGREAFIPPERRQGWDYWKAAECDHDYLHSHYYADNSSAKKYWLGFDACAQTKDAQDYLRAHTASGQPFVLFVSYSSPHYPIPRQMAPPEYRALYPEEKIQLPPNVPAVMQQKARRFAQDYYAYCTALDQYIGDLVATLNETGLAQNTIFIFTSDHGEMLGAHGVTPAQKQVPWDESAHVPFLLRFPAAHGATGRVEPTPLTTPDIFATVIGLAGVPLPPTAEGCDFSQLVHDPRASADHAALYMGVAPFAVVAQADNKAYRAIRTRRYTYVRSLAGPWLLFDDEEDPNQMNNLVNKPEHAALQRELEARLQTELKKIGDDFRDPQAYLDGWGYDVRSGDSIPTTPKAKVQSPHRVPRGTNP